MSALQLVSQGREQVAAKGAPHVLLVVDQFPRMLGGGERIVLKLAKLLPRWGYRTSILTFAIHGESRVAEEAPCPLWLLPLTKTYDLEAMRAALVLGRFLHEQEVRVVQTFFESSDLWAGLVTKAFSDAKLVWSRRDMGILRARKHAMAYRWMRRMPDAVMAVSKQVETHCVGVDGVPAERVKTVYNGLDLAGWDGSRNRGVRNGTIRVVTVGNIRRVKGHDVLVRAAALVRRAAPQVEFGVAGAVLEDGYMRELEGLIAENGLTEAWEFSGGLKDLRRYMGEADLFVLPSRSEGFSNAIIEAMAAGLPVVATDVGGNAEAVEEGVTGYVVAAEDPVALSAAILRLVEDPALARLMGAAGREAVGKRFTTEAMLNGVAGLYRELLEREVTA